MDVGDRWADVADHLAPRLADHVLPFLDLQHLYGLAARRMEATRAASPTSPRTPPPASRRTSAPWQQVCLPPTRPAGRAQGDWAATAEKLGTALPPAGGDWRQPCAATCSTRSGWTRCAAHRRPVGRMQNLLQPLCCNAQPQSVRLARQARQVNQALGLPDPAHEGFTMNFARHGISVTSY